MRSGLSEANSLSMNLLVSESGLHDQVDDELGGRRCNAISVPVTPVTVSARGRAVAAWSSAKNRHASMELAAFSRLSTG